MAKISDVTLKGMGFEIYSLTGQVKDSRKWTSTHVSGGGGGGGGYLHGGSGYVSTQPVDITSTTTTHDQLFVQGSDGKEICVETTDAKLQVRPGHLVSVVWIIKKGKDRGLYWVIHNHHTDKTEWLDVSSLLRPWVFGKGGFWWVLTVLVVPIAGFGMMNAMHSSDREVFFLTFLAGVVIGIWTFWTQLRIRGRKKQLKRHFASAVLPILAQSEKVRVSPPTG